MCAVEKLWVRKTGLEFLVDIHIEVDAKLTVERGNAIGHAVKDRLHEDFAEFHNVLVHLEPFPHLRDEAGRNVEPFCGTVACGETASKLPFASAPHERRLRIELAISSRVGYRRT